VEREQTPIAFQVGQLGGAVGALKCPADDRRVGTRPADEVRIVRVPGEQRTLRIDDVDDHAGVAAELHRQQLRQGLKLDRCRQHADKPVAFQDRHGSHDDRPVPLQATQPTAAGSAEKLIADREGLTGQNGHEVAAVGNVYRLNRRVVGTQSAAAGHRNPGGPQPLVACGGIGEGGVATIASGANLRVARQIAQNDPGLLQQSVLPIGGQRGEQPDALLGTREGPFTLIVRQLKHHRHQGHQNRQADEHEAGPQAHGTD
jgi:hypothetical protein